MDEAVRDIAIAHVIAKWMTALKERNDTMVAIESLQERVRQIDIDQTDYRATCRVLGYDFNVTEQANAAMEKYGLAAGRIMNGLPPFDPVNEPQIINEPALSKTDEAPSPPPGFEVVRPKIRDLVLARLKEAAPEGLKAAAIREWIEKTYRIEIHEKTVGMTLYRLLRDGHARREGRIWFLSLPDGGDGNPGGGTPGPINNGIS